jgi:hypothetical protein
LFWFVRIKLKPANAVRLFVRMHYSSDAKAGCTNHITVADIPSTHLLSFLEHRDGYSRSVCVKASVHRVIPESMPTSDPDNALREHFARFRETVGYFDS